MKTIGLIGGMSWESSVIYYQLINRQTQEILGGVHSAQVLMYSVEFGVIAELQSKGDWAELGGIMVDAARRLERGGADFILICANTMHLLAGEITQAVKIPLLHIGDATGAAIQKAGMKKVGLLGTKYTMEKDFLKKHLADKFGIETIIPDEADREQVHAIIYNELAKGQVKDESREIYLSIIDKLIAAGAEGIILGCTEIPMLISPEDTQAILFDTTKLHAEAAVAMAFSDEASSAKTS